MFTVENKQENQGTYLVLQNQNKTSKAIISLDQGARITSLQFNNITLIKEQPNFNYKDSYASAVLFPFASRIENGTYYFKGEKYQLDCNQDAKNALHGLIYNKKFILFEQEEHSDFCSVTLRYFENDLHTGFPFKFSIAFTYTLSENNLKLQITVKNIDEKSFPFTLGWHPYFFTENLSKSYLKFNSNQQVLFDKNLITKELIPYSSDDIFKIEDKQLDDCFVLTDNRIQFFTPMYSLEITTDVAENYLQMYTPENRSIIAIEPMTGISNSFNNKIGLQVLPSKKSYSVAWNVKVVTK